MSSAASVLSSTSRMRRPVETARRRADAATRSPSSSSTGIAGRRTTNSLPLPGPSLRASTEPQYRQPRTGNHLARASDEKADERFGFWQERRALDEFVDGVEALAARAEPVDGGDAGGGDGVGVGAAADERRFVGAEPGGERAGGVFGQQRARRVGALERDAADAAAHLDLRAGDGA